MCGLFSCLKKFFKFFRFQLNKSHLPFPIWCGKRDNYFYKKQTETIKEPKEKKVRTVKVGTHKKAVIALWVVLIASVSFGVYKNFTAIDQHTTHEKEIIELRLQDTNGIENFVKNFAMHLPDGGGVRISLMAL